LSLSIHNIQTKIKKLTSVLDISIDLISFNGIDIKIESSSAIKPLNKYKLLVYDSLLYIILLTDIIFLLHLLTEYLLGLISLPHPLITIYRNLISSPYYIFKFFI